MVWCLLREYSSDYFDFVHLAIVTTWNTQILRSYTYKLCNLLNNNIILGPYHWSKYISCIKIEYDEVILSRDQPGRYHVSMKYAPRHKIITCVRSLFPYIKMQTIIYFKIIFVFCCRFGNLFFKVQSMIGVKKIIIVLILISKTSNLKFC